jgi:hypothetical protein
MRHPTDDEIILLHYGELPEASDAGRHVASCESCRAERERLAAELAPLERLAVPERGESYGRDLWRRLSPRLERRAPARPFFSDWRPLALSASLAALLAAAFLAGRFWPPRPEAAGPSDRSTRERILVSAVADHLDRAQIVLLEFVHGDASEESRQTRLAEELVSANRLYRQTAARAGERGVVGVLEELERVLLEIAHSPTPEARDALRRRIESEGTLFKVRILRSELGRREKAAEPPPLSRT